MEISIFNNLKFDIKRFVNYLNSNDLKYKKIAVQISDNLLEFSVSIIKILQKEFPTKLFFVIAETSYGICCADEVAAQHLNADLILRIGKSCLTPTQLLPVYFMNESKDVDIDKLNDIFKVIESTYSSTSECLLVNYFY